MAIEEKSLSTIRVFPNPVIGGIIHIKSKEHIDGIELINLSGIKEHVQMERLDGEIWLSLMNLKSGSYFLLFETKKGRIHQKIMIMD